jgi:hypothetical protein
MTTAATGTPSDYTPAAAAPALGISVTAVTRRLRSGAMRGSRQRRWGSPLWRIPASEVEDWRSRSPQAMARPHCRLCGRPAGNSGQKVRSSRTYDPATNTVICRLCQESAAQRTITCRTCYKTVTRPARLIAKLTSKEETERGLTYLCRECQSRDRMRRVTQPRLLARYNVHSDASPDERKEALRDQMAVAVRAAGGRQRLQALRTAARRHGLSSDGKRRLSINKLIAAAATTTGEYDLCRQCGKLSYLPPSRLMANALHFHRACYRAFMASPIYQDWREQLGDLRSPTLEARKRRLPHPIPPRPGGRHPTSREIARWIPWLLMRTLRRMSWAEIATAVDPKAPPSRNTIRNGVLRLAALLPERWSIAFHGNQTGRRLDALLPVPTLRRALDQVRAAEVL